MTKTVLVLLLLAGKAYASPTGWTCQEPGGTGGQCSAFAICSRLQ